MQTENAQAALNSTDPEIFEFIKAEERRQVDSIRLIASENYVSEAVLAATGSVLTNKYSEGYAGKRYYEGQEHIDLIEKLAMRRARKLFGADSANVQPYSGSPANLAVYFAFMEPGETVMGMSLPHGGHLTHGWPVSITGSFFKSEQYTVHEETHRLDYDQIREKALAVRPKLIIAGATAYPRFIDFAAFRSIADEVGATLLIDMAHIAGLVAGGAHPSPVPFADVVSTTTHKTLRGPRGGMLLFKKAHRKAMNRAVFPGLQGGPHNHTTAAIAVALQEAATDDFKDYAAQIVKNAARLGEELSARGFRLITGGTDNHLLLIDTTARGVPGRPLAAAMNRAGVVANSNTIPFDPRTPFDPSGIRIGTPAITSRGMKEDDMATVAGFIDRVTNIAAADGFDPAAEELPALDTIASEVREFVSAFPAPGLAQLVD